MKIPDGMTEQEVIDLIRKVSKRLAPKYTFAHFDRDDIAQEAFMIGMDGLERYNSDYPLENFLYTHIGNRLKDFKRNNYIRLEECELCGGTDPNCRKCYEIQKKQTGKKNVMQPISIGEITDKQEHNMWCQEDFVGELELEEALTTIDQKLEMSMRADYLRLRDGVMVPKQKREKVEAEVLTILEDAGYDV